MNSSKKIQRMKIFCWIGVAVDALWVLALVWPKLFTVLTGNTAMADDLPVRLIAGIAASMMAGWTVLLAWAAQNPVERRAVMLFTAIPVITGLFCVSLIGNIYGQGGKVVWVLVKTAGLFAAMLWGYFTANKIAKEDVHEIHN
ncbi:hypothetical protein [Desulfospira joergensenii]|uniref:hypothetical protein n=1 Tax=Desulfospira joergensenii TaxID=53329 RepID=UPI00040049A0|nr:hypothetical protein [Desulfospira joergensenii]